MIFGGKISDHRAPYGGTFGPVRYPARVERHPDGTVSLALFSASGDYLRVNGATTEAAKAAAGSALAARLTAMLDAHPKPRRVPLPVDGGDGAVWIELPDQLGARIRGQCNL